MRAAFYAPLKSPNHPVVSGDREVARLIMRALQLNDYTVEVASELRVFVREPEESLLSAHMNDAEAEIDRLLAAWRDGATPPDLWVTYHPYYKSPDLIGPEIAAKLRIPYVTIEASYSRRRNIGGWAKSQEIVARLVNAADLNLCLTKRDHDGLSASFPEARLALLPPFIDTSHFEVQRAETATCRLAVVAMMRQGDKFESYRMLAKALALLPDIPWTLDVVGDGPSRAETLALFDKLPRDRLNWLGLLERQAIASIFSRSSLYVWPGCGEAFGLAYLEAQASGLAVVAQNTAGVPEVVRHAETGLLTEDGNVEAYAAAILRLINDAALRRRMGDEAARRVRNRHSLEAGARNLAMLLEPAMRRRS